jgi:transcriptional regulator with XRE-family HTH domain
MKKAAREAEMFGAALKRWRDKRGLTQNELAHRAGIGGSYASHLERGEKVPSLTIILKLARALEVTLGDFLSDFTPSVMKRLPLDD